LALGIGGTTAIFSILYGAVLHAFPYVDSHRLVVLVHHEPKDSWEPGPAYLSGPEFLDYQEQNHVFDEVIGRSPDQILVTGIEAPESFIGMWVTDNYFHGLGVPALIGRPLTSEDGRPGAPPVAVLSHKVWQAKFGSDPGIVGRMLILNRRPTTVVGVMPPRFSALRGDILLPATPSKNQSKDGPYFWLFARLKPGVSFAQARADVAVLSKRFAGVYNHPPESSFEIRPITYFAEGDLSKTLYIFLGAVGLLLMIACVNVANLLLARATAREKEIAIRAALGASRGRLVRQMMIESLLLALGGGILGCLFAWNGLDTLVALFPPDTFDTGEVLIRVNGAVLLFTLGVAVLSTLLFGLAPALLAASKDLQEPLKANGRGTGEGLHHLRLRNLLMVSEVALSLVLLTGAGLLIRSFFALHQVQPGYNPNHVLFAWFNLPPERYQTVEQRNQFNIELLRRVRSLPGVVSASLGWPRPTYCCFQTAFELAGKPSPEKRRAQFHRSSDRFFETLGVQLLHGRSITEEDFVHARTVVVVNGSFVTKYFGTEIPLGQQIKVAGVEGFGIPGRQDRESLVQHTGFEIIGVVEDIRDNGPEKPPQPGIYIPYTVGGMPTGSLFVRTTAEPTRLTNSLRRAVVAIDKELPLGTASMEDDLKSTWYSEPRFAMSVMAAFAALGLTLVSIGVYSVLSYAVSRRTQEIGIRMALGAEATDVRRMVIMSGLHWLGIGIGIGAPASIAFAKILQNRIWGIKSADPLTLIAVSLLLTVVGLAACYVPARRATKVDPMVALRCE
jgi:predicted permease